MFRQNTICALEKNRRLITVAANADLALRQPERNSDSDREDVLAIGGGNWGPKDTRPTITFGLYRRSTR